MNIIWAARPRFNIQVLEWRFIIAYLPIKHLRLDPSRWRQLIQRFLDVLIDRWS